LSLKQKLILALTAYAALAFLAWQTLSSEPIAVGSYFRLSFRSITLAVLGLFALRTVMTWMRYDHESASDKSSRVAGVSEAGARRRDLERSEGPEDE
jgi:thiol:disulfide interchange protein